MSVTLDKSSSSEPKPPPKKIELPLDLSSRLYRQFDDLVAKGEILWAPYENEHVEDRGFEAVFQTAPHLTKKPIQKPSDPSRRTGKGGSRNPFLDPDPAFVVAKVGPSHTFLLNKYSVYRPSAILHTNEFAMQSDDLDEVDLRAAIGLLRYLEGEEDSNGGVEVTHRNGEESVLQDEGQERGRKVRERPDWLLIYNCGINAGSSQGHKHMQLWPYPSEKDIGFELFPEKLIKTHPQQPKTNAATREPLVDSSLPQIQFTLPLSDSQISPSDDDVIQAYSNLLKHVRKAHQRLETGVEAYNVALTTRSLSLIPRRRSGAEKDAGANTAGMLGLLWVAGDEEKRVWMKDASGSLRSYVEWLGVPNRVEEAPSP